MVQPLLITKLARPQVRPNLVSRPRLTQIVRQVETRPLTLVCAPAGYGKTTLIAEWLPNLPTMGWLSLDESDNDPIRFWTYVIAAWQTAAEHIGTQSLALLQSPQPPPLTLTLTFLINDLSTLPESLFLILDDYHFINNQTVHESLAYFLEHLPAHVHIILTSRADPPLPLARLRVMGQLVEVRERDLCFTAEETATFMQQVMGLSLTAGQLQALTERSEGWIASLQLAGLAAAGASNVTEIFNAFSGSQRFLVDYLTEEVLARQPEKIQQFLLQTAVLERFCAPLCEAVLELGEWDLEIPTQPLLSNLQSLLEYLERLNLFLVPLDNERYWYRYHHLFADLLRFRAAQIGDKASQRRIHQRAATWFADRQLWHEAIDQALAAGDREQAGQFIAQQASTTIARGERATLQAWLAGLSSTQVKGNDRLRLAQAWVDLFFGRIAEAESWVQPVLDNAQAAPTMDNSLWGEALAIRATLAFARQEAEQTINDSEQALALLSEAQLPLRTLLSWHLAFTYRSMGATRLSLEVYHQAIEMSRCSGNFLINLSARRELAEILLGQSNLTQAQALLNDLLAEATANGWEHLMPVAGAHVHLGEIFYEWNLLETAVTHLQTVISHPQAHDMSFDAYAHALLARIHAAQNDRMAAVEAIQQAEQSVIAAVHPQRRVLTLAQICRFWLAQGDLTRAAAWLPDGQDIPQDMRHEVYARQQMTHAHFLLAASQKTEAARLVAALQPLAEASGRVRDAVELWLLQAQLCDGGEAETAVRQALTLAEPAGLLRTFLDSNQAIAALLTTLQGHTDTPTHYLNRLLATVALATESPANRLLVEPLSDRELEVLRLMAEGYSNREIADRLIFTIATAKKHAEHIYGKLGVNSRTQAIARARELNLL